jgi:NADH dehydrogenase/NADH:ubiquinone oxidoreductase subunit G
MTGRTSFTIQAEKVPNRKGIERVMELLGGPKASLDELGKSTKLKGGWIVGGYLSEWVTDALKLPRGIKIVQDILPNKLTSSADAVIPGAAWAEKDGCWENFAGKIQPFVAAVPPPDGVRRDGDVYFKLLGRAGLFNAEDVRKEMGAPFASVKLPSERAEEPAFEFVEL